MPVVNGYCSVTQLQAHLSDTGTVTDTELLERAINAVSRAIDRYCSGGVPGWRRFWADSSAVAHTFHVDSPVLAWVDDISTTVGLVVKTDEDDDGTFETTWTINTDFQLEPLNADAQANTAYAWWRIAAVGDRTFPRYDLRAGLQVTAKFGWSSVPVDVEQACVLKAARLFGRKDTPDGVLGASEFGTVRISRYEDPDVAALLEPFRKRRTRTLTYQPQRHSLFHRRGWGW